MSAFKIMHDVIDQIGVAAIIVMLYSEVIRKNPSVGLRRDLLRASIFAVGVIITMLDPLQIGSGIQLDGRQVLIGLASFLIGPLGAAITLGAGTAMRLSTGGTGLVAGLSGMAITALVGLLWRAHLGRQSHSFSTGNVMMLGVLINACVLSIIVLPSEVAIRVLAEGAPVVVISNLIGCLLVGSMLARESRRIECEESERMTARTDFLTGLANRRGFEEELARLATNGDHTVALLLIDVDNFKGVNDTYGHAKGDDVLREVASVIKAQTRSGDVAARLGGDEFVVVLKGLSAASAEQIGERVCSNVRRGFGEIPVTVSVGVAVAVSTSSDPAALIATADSAMYRAKVVARGSVGVAAA